MFPKEWKSDLKHYCRLASMVVCQSKHNRIVVKRAGKGYHEYRYSRARYFRFRNVIGHAPNFTKHGCYWMVSKKGETYWAFNARMISDAIMTSPGLVNLISLSLGLGLRRFIEQQKGKAQ